jgi:serine/threonine protein kinase
VVLRDVKPSKVVVRDGAARPAVLVDFGIARSDAATRVVTATGAVVGTPAYMSPEQARAERGVDARADVFSLGCVRFERLARQPPFIGERRRGPREDPPRTGAAAPGRPRGHHASARRGRGRGGARRRSSGARRRLRERPARSAPIGGTERRYTTILLGRAVADAVRA